MNKYIKEANQEALKGMRSNDGGPFGAVIVKNNKIIAKGHNTVVRSNDPTNHAEMNALRSACKKLKRFDLSDCEIYINAAPCPMCLSAIAWARIKKVYYGCGAKDTDNIGFSDYDIYEMFKNPKKSKIKLQMKQLDRNECLKAFNEWKNKSDKTPY